MAVKRSSGKKASAAKKKASAKKSPARKTAKKAAAKTKPAKKAASSRKAAKKKETRHAKPKLGFDPLSREDIEVLTSSRATGPALSDGKIHTGIDALIRDTSHESSHGALSDTPRPEPATLEPAIEKDETPPAVEPEEHLEAAASEAPEPEAPEPDETPVPSALALIEEEMNGTDIVLGEKEEPEAISIISEEPETIKDTGEPEAAEPVVPVAARPEETPETVQKVKKPEPAGTPAVKSAEQDEERAGLSTYFSFRLGKESFAVPIERVREVLEYQEPTKVPKTPPHMLGVINLRGGVVPVVGLRNLFGMQDVERTVHSAVIILEVENAGEASVIGVLVDGVREVVDIRESDVAPPPRLGTGLNTDFLSGMGKLGDEFLMILDVDSAFSIDVVIQ